MTRRKNSTHIPAELSILAKLVREYGHPEPLSDHDNANQLKQPYNAKQWRELSRKLKDNFAPHDREQMQTLAQGVREALLWCDETMDRYCNNTCHGCQDFCCQADGIYFDLPDLIYILTLDNDLPTSQTRAIRGAPCRYLGEEGCILPRMCRPFICTWYLCEPQMALLEAEPISFQKQFTAVMQLIRRCRQQMLAMHEKGQNNHH